MSPRTEGGWCCPRDRRALECRGERLVCPDCRGEYDAADGIAVFAAPDERSAEQPAALDELWRLLERLPHEEAAREFCRAHGCARPAAGAGRSSFVALAGGAQVLEIGSGFGDNLLELARHAARATSIQPTRASARIVARHAREAGTDVSVAVVDSLERLPLADGSLELIATDDAGLRGFGLDAASLSAVAGEWKRVLAGGGRLVLGLENRWLRGLARRGTASLDDCLKRALAASAPSLPAVASLVGCIVGQGFGSPEIRAPLPHENEPRVLVPVSDRPLLRYVLRNLVRRNSLAARAGVAGAEVAVALGLFRHLVPYRYLTFSAAGRK